VQPRDGDSGWVVTSETEAIYVSWLEVDGQLTGSVQVATLDAAGTTVTPATHPLTGQHSGSQISLDIAGLGIWQGSISDNRLVLRVPQRDGELSKTTFVRGGIDVYNSALTALEHSAAVAQAKVIEGKAESAHTSEVVKAAAHLSGAVQTLEDGIDRLPDALARYGGAAHDGMADAMTNLDHALDAHPLVCSDVGYARDSIGAARDAVTSQRASLDSQLDAVESAEAAARSDLTELLDLQPATNTSYAETALDVAGAVVAEARAQARMIDADADAVVPAATAKAHALCPDN
jgi:hypothetical protein